MSIFDAESFFDDVQISGDANTEYLLLPPKRYPAQVTSIAPRKWESEDGSQSAVYLDVGLQLTDPEVIAEFGPKNFTYTFRLEMVDGSLDTRKGHNVPLGLLRVACGLTDASKRYSFHDFIGCEVLADVIENKWNDKQTGEARSNNKVKGVSKP